MTTHLSNPAKRLQKLISAPEDELKSMLTDRNKELLSVNESERFDFMKQTILSTDEIDKERLKVLTKARMEILADFSTEDRGLLMLSWARAAKEVPKELEQRSMKEAVQACRNWPIEKRARMFNEIEHAYQEVGLPKPDFEALLRLEE
ncbi:MAG: hypothetical protein ACXADC_10355 [Candidatus Thorarchaeota archaeon]